MSNLYRVFHKGLSGTRKLYPADDNYIDAALELIKQNPEADYYESIYVYNDKHLKQLEETKTLAGIQDVKTNRIVFDFDSKNDIELAQRQASELVERLILSIPEEAIRIFSSGSKGYHIEVHLNQYVSRKEFEAIVDHYAGDFSSFDQKIKDQQRLFRFPLTRHQASKRFKIPLSVAQLKTLNTEQIQKLSLRNDKDEFYDLLANYLVIDIPEDFKEACVVKPELENKLEVSDKPSLTNRPKHLTPAKYVLQEGFFEEGERNEACMILASTYKYLGYNQEHTYNIIKATLRLRTERLGLPEYDKSELWNTIVKPVYSPTWKGGTFTEEDGLLKRTIERYDLKNAVTTDVTLVDVGMLSGAFMDFATNIDANTIKLGIEEIDSKVRITTSSLVAWLAAPSAGKSSVAFGILNTLSNSNERAIFLSMDMSIPQVYQRLIQRHTGHNEDIIMKNFKEGRSAEIENYTSIINSQYKNVRMCFRSGLTPSHVRELTLDHQKVHGMLPRLVIIDYLECMSVEGISDSTQSKARIATELKGIANELGICIILLVQPRMMAGGPAGELNSYTDIKGSSVIGEAAAQVFTMSRPGFSPKNPDDDNYVTINVVKNRMGRLSSTDLHWNGLTGHIRSLSGEEENDLKALRSAIAAEKQGSDNPGGGLY